MTDPYIGINGTKIEVFDNDLSAVTTPKQMAESSKSGDNLLLNPEFQVGATANLPLYWGAYQTPTINLAADTLAIALGGNQITITGSGASLEGIIIAGGTANWLKVKPSTTYTFSFYYYTVAGDNLHVDLRSYNGATPGTFHLNVDNLNSQAGSRYTFTFTTDANATNLSMSFLAVADGDVCIVSHPKLEEGSVATPFEPCHARARLSSKIITATRDMAAASGDVSYTGLDFTPTSILCLAAIGGTDFYSIGFVDSGKGLSSLFPSQAHVFYTDSNYFIQIFTSSTTVQKGIIKTFNANVGFTITWTKTGLPTGTITLYFLCFR